MGYNMGMKNTTGVSEMHLQDRLCKIFLSNLSVREKIDRLAELAHIADGEMILNIARYIFNQTTLSTVSYYETVHGLETLLSPVFIPVRPYIHAWITHRGLNYFGSEIKRLVSSFDS